MQVFLENLDPEHVTMVNDQPVKTRWELKSNDVFAIADRTFKFVAKVCCLPRAMFLP
jgi:pSer/pThr/pTyr-binding forkhead associated (FHA) protein